MFVAASTECFTDLSPSDALQTLVDLEYTAVELALHEDGGWLKPSLVHADLNRAIDICLDTRRMDVIALSVGIEAEGDDYYAQFESCCKLAKAIKVVTMVVPSSELGTPFNAEIERLQELVRIAALEGARVGVKTQVGCMTEDPDTAVVLCDNVRGLGLTLDPSHLLVGPQQSSDCEKLADYVFHTHLRDSSKSELQVRVGQGEIEYGRLIGQLVKANYDRALSVHMVPLDGHDHRAELRKMRLLLDSLL